MKITKSTLKQLIKEELQAVLQEEQPTDSPGDHMLRRLSRYTQPVGPAYWLAELADNMKDIMFRKGWCQGARPDLDDVMKKVDPKILKNLNASPIEEGELMAAYEKAKDKLLALCIAIGD